MKFDYAILVTMFVVCLAIRAEYETLKEAHKIDLESKPVFAVILSVMILLWFSWFSLCPQDPYPAELPAVIRWFGLGVFIAGMLLALGALIQLRGVENIDHLVTTGLFKKLRHPMYVGFVAWIVGWSLYHGALLSLAVGSAGIVSVFWWRHLEDIRLRLQFGDLYAQYRKTTWF